MSDKFSPVPVVTGKDIQPVLVYVVMGADKPQTLSLLDAHGKPIDDLHQRIEIQENLVSSLIDMWQKDQAILQQKNVVLPPSPARQESKPDIKPDLKPVYDQKNLREIGYKDENGWCYAGISVTTGTGLWVSEKSTGRNSGSWNKTIENMKQKIEFHHYPMSGLLTMLPLQEKGKTIEEHLRQKDDSGVRLATIGELRQLYENKEDLGDCLVPRADWYWSLSEFRKGFAQALSFKSGKDNYFEKTSSQAVLYVRTEPY